MGVRATLVGLAALIQSACGVQPATGQDISTERPEARLNYERMRNMVLDLTPEALDLADVPGDAVFGVVMDMDVDGETATLIGLTTGDASMYTSTGGGVIGGFAHPSVGEAARAMVRAGEDLKARLEPATDRSGPGPNEIRFYVLTEDGLLTAVAPADDLLDESHPLFPLFFAGNNLLTALRMASSAT